MCVSDIPAPRRKANHEIVGFLWDIHVGLLGISELFKNQSPEALFSVDGAHGIGVILGDLSSKISHVADSIGQQKEDE